MRRTAVPRWPVLAAVIFGAAVWSALLWRRRWLTWGATPREADGELPGDALLPRADLVSTRAIEIAAPPASVWPWLVQMGSGRGGAYTYDWIENLFDLDMHSADTILPEFQDLAVGDVIPLGARGPRMRVGLLDRERAMAVRSEDGNWVWTFTLVPDGPNTRLISRNRISLAHMPRAVRLPYMMAMTPGSLVMERKMLHGIKSRAERLAVNEAAAGDSA
jgi:hypothetical protein